MRQPHLLASVLLLLTPSIGSAADLWVDDSTGSDANDGLGRDRALRTIQSAADRAQPGDVIHVLPGLYRETVVPAVDGTASQPIVFPRRYDVRYDAVSSTSAP